MITARMLLQSDIVTSRGEDGAVQTRVLGFVPVQGDTSMPANTSLSVPVLGNLPAMDRDKVYEISIKPAPASK